MQGSNRVFARTQAHKLTSAEVKDIRGKIHSEAISYNPITHSLDGDAVSLI